MQVSNYRPIVAHVLGYKGRLPVSVVEGHERSLSEVKKADI